MRAPVAVPVALVLLVTTALTVVSLVGCHVGTPTTSVSTAAPPATLASATASATGPAGPSPSAGTTIDPTALPLREGPLTVGEFRVAQFQPTFSFVIREPGWSIEYLGSSAIGLLRAPSGDVGEFGLNVFRVDSFINAVDTRTGQLVDAPGDIAQWLQGHRYLDLVDGPEETSIDGLDAVQFDMVATQDPGEMAPGGGEPGMVPLLGGAGGCCLNLEPGAAYRWIFFEIDGVPMWVNVLAFEGEQLDTVVEEARSVIQSIAFE